MFKTAPIARKHTWEVLAVSASPDNICHLAHQSRQAVGHAPWLPGICGLSSSSTGLAITSTVKPGFELPSLPRRAIEWSNFGHCGLLDGDPN